MRREWPAFMWFPIVTTTVAVLGCASSPPAGPYTAPSQTARDPMRSQSFTEEAVGLISSNPDRAEVLLREALTADLYNGPAHNNLGSLYLDKGMLYEAAGEFEWARKLMPGHPDPRLNLALTLERAGRTDEALATYAAALEVSPEHIGSMQAMTSLQLRTGKSDERTSGMLEEIALRGESHQWRNWAKGQLLGLAR